LSVSEFQQWVNAVDQRLLSLIGPETYALSDAHFYAWFEDGLTVDSAVEIAIETLKNGEVR